MNLRELWHTQNSQSIATSTLLSTDAFLQNWKLLKSNQKVYCTWDDGDGRTWHVVSHNPVSAHLTTDSSLGSRYCCSPMPYSCWVALKNTWCWLGKDHQPLDSLGTQVSKGERSQPHLPAPPRVCFLLSNNFQKETRLGLVAVGRGRGVWGEAIFSVQSLVTDWLTVATAVVSGGRQSWSPERRAVWISQMLYRRQNLIARREEERKTLTTEGLAIAQSHIQWSLWQAQSW